MKIAPIHTLPTDCIALVMRKTKGDRWLMSATCSEWAKIARELRPICGVGPSWLSVTSSFERMVYSMNKRYVTPYKMLSEALSFGRIDILELAVAGGVALCCIDLDISASLGHTAMVKYMHTIGVPWGSNTIMCAARNNRAETCRELLLEGCPCDYLSVATAAMRGHDEVLQVLIDFKCPAPKTLVCMCVYNNRLACLKIALTVHPFDIHDGLFFNACVRGFVEIVQFISQLPLFTTPLEVDVLLTMDLEPEIVQILNSL